MLPIINTMYQQNELTSKYYKDPQFAADMDEARNLYQQALRISSKASLSHFKEGALEKFPHKSSLYFYYGAMQSQKANHKQLYAYFIRQFGPQPKEGYTLVYFNVDTSAYCLYDSLRSIFMLLPIGFYVNLKEFIVVAPTFYHRALDYFTFGTINKYVKAKTTTCNTCHQLCDKFAIPLKEFVTFVPPYLTKQFPLELQSISLTENRMNYLGHSLSEEQRQAKKQFEDQIAKMISQHGYCIQDYEVGSVGIPQLLELLVYYFRKQPENLCLEGIFRKSVSIVEEQEVFQNIKNGDYDCLQRISNPYLVANLIKRFFANLKVPVIPFDKFSQLMKVYKDKDKVKAIIRSLPLLNFETIMFVLEFLIQEVIIHADKNLMGEKNIAVVFTPCFMRSEQISAADIAHMANSIVVTSFMISHFDQFFGDKAARRAIFRKSFMVKKETVKEAISLKIAEQQLIQLEQDEIEEHQPQVPTESCASLLASKIPHVTTVEQPPKSEALQPLKPQCIPSPQIGKVETPAQQIVKVETPSQQIVKVETPPQQIERVERVERVEREEREESFNSIPSEDIGYHALQIVHLPVQASLLKKSSQERFTAVEGIGKFPSVPPHPTLPEDNPPRKMRLFGGISVVSQKKQE